MQDGDWDSRIANLIKWLENGGSFISPRLKVKSDLVYGRSIWIDSDAKEHEQLISIKFNYTLNVVTVCRQLKNFEAVDSVSDVENFYANLKNVCETLNSFQLIPLFLVCESRRGPKSFWSPFVKCLPRIEELSGMPMTWLWRNQESRSWTLLPKWSRERSQEQLERFKSDWKIVSKVLSDCSYSDLIREKEFLWAWLCCNTRCLYMELPASLALSTADNISMVPYLDFINHDYSEAAVEPIAPPNIDQDWRLLSGKKTKQGEVCFSYHCDSDEYFLCEYGFMLEENTYNHIQLDFILNGLFKPEQRKFLEDNGYWGDYKVYSDEITFRTEVALAVLQETTNFAKIEAFMNGESENSYTVTSTRFLKKVLQKYQNWCLERLSAIRSYETDENPYLIQLYNRSLKVVNQLL
ncbi:unnamed protein product [Kuraishia capsulata CBS 1993]|uniref:Uncharacterized protein n=1 Tax=Kuraishia capsulata CBS 1993 TaxID=1382522 RepID=W6MFK4_9ASCO|nr:uncharacterized protein KUCA_T00000575001 [Kuraishia capsulata CBS 1993]CDK24609.1 unnamed protein product [Kuraishia capsulata CBS 1993]